jgi:hypothetical protein
MSLFGAVNNAVQTGVQTAQQTAATVRAQVQEAPRPSRLTRGEWRADLKTGVSFVVVLVLVGCMPPRVIVPRAPPPNAPLERREQYLLNLSPAGAMNQLVTGPAVGGVAPGTVSPGCLALANGLRVCDPRDLSPAVAPNSLTVERALKWSAAAERGATIFAQGVAGAAASFVVGFLSVHGDRVDTAMLSVGLGGLVASSLVMILGLIGLGEANSFREAAFLSYNDDLHARLAHAEQDDASPGAAAQRPPPDAPRCVASERPEWREASAVEKKRMLAECAREGP